ncbi:gamma-parvin [Perognathus longimembris pacificus]|uniref:gamma-parvin n=1 Tax=Perognathus longimembris pacificus TaxID=214514 RepID=UPI002018FF7E|nr:gamma-parvin [Perognathus longimembris pacificus]
MEPDPLYNLLQLPTPRPAEEEELPQGEKKKFLPPNSRRDRKFEELQKALLEWLNATLLPEHIVVRSLEEDMFDGLVLHHLFQTLSGLRLEVEEIALTAASQRRKLGVVLEAVNRSLHVEEPEAKWGVEAIFHKDLLATLHLLVALARRFQPGLRLPSNVQVEVLTIESTKSGLKSEKFVEQLTECGTDKDQPASDVFDELFRAAPEKVAPVKEAVLSFVNGQLQRLGLSVQDLDTQFADGVFLLLLIGQLEGFFLHLKEFYLTPSSPEEMVSPPGAARVPGLGAGGRRRQRASGVPALSHPSAVTWGVTAISPPRPSRGPRPALRDPGYILELSSVPVSRGGSADWLGARRAAREGRRRSPAGPTRG